MKIPAFSPNAGGTIWSSSVQESRFRVSFQAGVVWNLHFHSSRRSSSRNKKRSKKKILTYRQRPDRYPKQVENHTFSTMIVVSDLNWQLSSSWGRRFIYIEVDKDVASQKENSLLGMIVYLSFCLLSILLLLPEACDAGSYRLASFIFSCYKLHKHKKKFPIAPVAPGDFCSTYTTREKGWQKKTRQWESLPRIALKVRS